MSGSVFQLVPPAGSIRISSKDPELVEVTALVMTPMTRNSQSCASAEIKETLVPSVLAVAPAVKAVPGFEVGVPVKLTVQSFQPQAGVISPIRASGPLLEPQASGP